MRTLLIGFFIWFFASSALAEPSYQLYRLPVGRRVTISNTDTYQCFNLADYKLLLKIDEDLRDRDSLIEDGKKALLELDKQSKLYAERVRLEVTETSKLQVRLTEKDRALTDLAVKYEKQNSQLMRLRKVFMYSVAGAVLLIGGTAFGVWIASAH